jgi:hypothetical protein
MPVATAVSSASRKTWATLDVSMNPYRIVWSAIVLL